MTYFVMAVALVLGLSQCKKEQTTTPQSEGVMITLNVGDNNNGTRANVDPIGATQVTFVDGDQILVASHGAYVGTLTKSTEEGVSKFRGSISDPTPGEPLYFYFLGNNAVLDAADPVDNKVKGCTVNISNQTYQTDYMKLPVISMGKSTVDYSSDVTSYSSRLYCKCSLMKFKVTTPSSEAICITGMNNKVIVDFGVPTGTTNGFTYGQVDGGLIKLKGGSGTNVEKWAIVLPNEDVNPESVAYSEDNNYTGNCPEIHVIEVNKFYDSGISMSVNTHAWDVNSVFLNMNNAGNTYSEGGITVTATDNAYWASDAGIGLLDTNEKLTFESTVGNITKIEITIRSDIGSKKGTPSSGWEYSNYKLTWTGTPSSTVDLGCVASKGAPGEPGGGDEPGIDPWTPVIIENAFELNLISQVQFTIE